jgi:hypothetical protein
MHLCPKVVFPSRKMFSQEVLVDLMKKTKQKYVLPKLKQCYFATARRFQVDPKEIKCPLQWWLKHESMFPTVGFLAQQISGIVGSQIETKNIFSLAGIFTNLRRCCLQ